MEKLALIILNYNSSQDTIKCVKQLQELSADFKIIIVDNASTDDSLQKIKEAHLLDEKTFLVENPTNGGYNSGNNIGVRFAREHFSIDTFGVLNPDVLIPNLGVIQTMYNQLYAQDDFGMIGGMSILVDRFKLSQSAWDIADNRQVLLKRLEFWHRLPIKNMTNNNYSIKMLFDDLAQVECLVGCFFLIKDEVLSKIGLFDENVFLYCEENILGIQVKKLGYKALLSTKSFYYHNHDFSNEYSKLTLKKKLDRVALNYRSRSYMIRTYYKSSLIPGLIFIECLNVCQISLGHLKGKVKQLFRR